MTVEAGGRTATVPAAADVVDLEAPAPLREPERAAPRHRRLARTTWLVVAVVAVAWSAARALMAGDEVVNAGGWPQLRRFFGAAIHPEVGSDFLALTWDATLTTLAYAVLGASLSVVIGVVGGVLVSETWWRDRPGRRRRRAPAGWLAARAGLGLPRGVHEAVWGLFFITVLGLDPLVGVLAIGIPYGAVTAKVFSELLDEAPRPAYLAVRAVGAGRLKGFGYALVPHAFPEMLSYAFYRFECSIRASAILGIIGAGGLGFQLSLSFQSLRYEEMWTLLYALMIVSGLADLWSTSLRRRGLSPIPPGVGRGAGRPAPVPDGGPAHRPRRDRALVASLVGALGLVIISAWHLRLDVSTLWASRTRQLLGDLAGSAFPPDLGAERLAELGRLALGTLEMSVLAAAAACLAGGAVAFLAAGTFASGGGLRRLVPLAARAVLLFCRAVPSPVWALLLLLVLFPGPLPGAAALALYTFGVLGRLMAEVVETVDPRPVSALRAQGASAGQSVLYGLLPLVVSRFAGYGLYRWEVTIRETVVVGLVGAGGLGRLLQEQLAGFDYAGVLATLLVLIALTFLVDLVSAGVRRSLR